MSIDFDMIQSLIHKHGLREANRRVKRLRRRWKHDVRRHDMCVADEGAS